ncbi:sugar phosphate isomerase/epimerase family protein [Histidinibacterium lentulum]|uniref:Sugar phosphate isomerase/epimerase n=1 Tax=Histidinibacterium lentulum TaxID=2480588 RepID=A0A3N2RAH9_9RHOB|nr:sugar phosphate isomerase/epimerase [Histidinibacterium lentulum]ROU04356.1 sugar phosphate isomerase/epimerase [Histidinibacterium lentulum]
MTDFSYQLYSSRNFGPLEDTLRMVAEFGYGAVEAFGGIFAECSDLSALRATLDDCGLTMPTGHFGFEMVRDQPDRVRDIASAMGMSAVIVPAVGPDLRVQSAEGWRSFGRALAEAGKPLQDAGLTFGWHNHDFEFAAVEGEDKPLDLILAGDPSLVWEVDAAWIVKGKEDPAQWIARYSDRIIAAHVKDIAPEGEATDEDGWADVGHGTMDWTALMQQLRGTPCRHFVMEHDNPSDDRRFARRSIEAARGL